MKREEAIKWLKVINTKEFGWDEFALQESQREIRERCEQGVREAIDMAIEALSDDSVSREGYEEVKAYMDTLVDAFIEDGEELAESVKVVRCKDCRWYDNRYGDVCHNPRYGDGYANYQPPYVDEDYWCKDGERKGGDSE